MKQRNASSFATLRLSTVLALRWALPVRRSLLRASVGLCLLLPATPASAVTIDITSGFISMLVSFDFDPLMTLEGADFRLTNDFPQDSFQFTGSPNPAFFLHSPGTLLDFTGFADLSSPDALLIYAGAQYRASGQVHVTTSPVVVDSLVTIPFLLTGTIHGQSLTGPETVDLDLSGSGMLTARFTFFSSPSSDGSFGLESASYDISAIPEPATLMLLGAGVVALGVARGRRDPAGTRPRSSTD
jgi:PEP-CTERM motif-containing protein